MKRIFGNPLTHENETNFWKHNKTSEYEIELCCSRNGVSGSERNFVHENICGNIIWKLENDIDLELSRNLIQELD